MEMVPRLITFDSVAHKYTDEYGIVYTSVTTLLNKVKPTFDSRFWLMYKALEARGHKLYPDVKRSIIKVDGVEYKIDDLYNEKFQISAGLQSSAQTINNQWTVIKDDACAKGTAIHEYLEESINNFAGRDTYDISKLSEASLRPTAQQTYKLKISNLTELENSPLKVTHIDIYNKLVYFVSQGFVIYTEKRVYSAKHQLAGTIDLLLIRGKEFWILDWKTNKRPLKFEAGYFKKEWRGQGSLRIKVETDQFIYTGDCLNHPLSHIESCDGQTYTMQLSLYAYICELWGLTCMGLELIHLRDKNLPMSYSIVYKKLDAEILLNWHLEQLNAPKTVTSSTKNKFGIS